MRHADHGPELPPGQLLLALALLDGAALGPAELTLRVGEVLRPPRGVAAGQDALQERDYVPRMDIGRLEAQIRLIGHEPSLWSLLGINSTRDVDFKQQEGGGCRRRILAADMRGGLAGVTAGA